MEGFFVVKNFVSLYCERNLTTRLHFFSLSLFTKSLIIAFTNLGGFTQMILFILHLVFYKV